MVTCAAGPTGVGQDVVSVLVSCARCHRRLRRHFCALGPQHGPLPTGLCCANFLPAATCSGVLTIYLERAEGLTRKRQAGFTKGL